MEPFAEAVGSIDPGDAQALTSLARLIAAGDREAVANFLITSARGIAGDQFDSLVSGAPAEPEQPTTEAGEPDIDALVEQKLEAKLAEREKAAAEKAAQEKILADITAKLTDLGYEADAPEAAVVIESAKRIQQNDPSLTAVDALTKAHEEFEARLQERAIAYAKSKGGGAALQQGEPAPATPKDLTGKGGLDEARARMEARLRDINAPLTA